MPSNNWLCTYAPTPTRVTLTGFRFYGVTCSYYNRLFFSTLGSRHDPHQTGSGWLTVYESVVTLCYSQLMFSTPNFHLSLTLRLFAKTLPHKIIM